MNIDKLEGRELAVLVHERIFGESVPDVSPNDSWWIHLPDYPGDISAAWLVEERIAELGLIDEYCRHLNDIANARWDAGEKLGRSWQLIHATPEDRCRAALKAVESR